jgi:hypothetical protein
MFFFFLFFIGIVCNWFQNCTVFFILTLHQAVLWLDLSLWRWPQKKWSVILKVYFIANKSKYVWIHECTLFSLVAFIYVSHFCQIGYGGITLLWKRQMQDVCVCVCVLSEDGVPKPACQLQPSPITKSAVFSALVWRTMNILQLRALMGKSNISRRVSKWLQWSRHPLGPQPLMKETFIATEASWHHCYTCYAKHQTELAGCLQDSK